MDGKRKRTKTATSCLCSVKELVKSGLEKSELMRVQSQLNQLSKLVNSEVRRITDEEKKHGLQFKEKEANKCKCGNTFDPLGDDCESCDFCGTLVCTECLGQCEDGCVSFCEDCDCTMCKICESAILCEDCDCAVDCEHCGELVCKECTREVHMNCGPRGGFEKTMCENCVKYE